MTRTGVRAALIAPAVLAAGALGLGGAGTAAADQGTGRTYVDAPYSTQYVQPATPDPQNRLRPLPPTQAPGESKLWYHAGAWWALMLEPTGHTTRVFELMPDHSWHPTSAVVNGNTGSVGDALPDGDAVHVVTRGTDGSLYYVRLTFDGGAREYHAGKPVLVTPRDSLAPPMIVKSSAGTLWVGYVTTTNVVVLPSIDGGTTWWNPLTLASTPDNQTAQGGALVAFADSVGILWSDQASHAFDFAVHRNGNYLSAWSRERIQVPPAQEKSEVSLVRVPGPTDDTLAAAVTTASSVQTKPIGVPPVQVLVRTPDGHWSAQRIATEADALADPVLQVDEGTRRLELFGAHNGSIVRMEASLDDLRFPPGPGGLFLNGTGGNLAMPAVGRDPVDGTTGLVVLASDLAGHLYRHAEQPINSGTPAGDPGDHTPPRTPTGLQARAVSSDTVVLSWAAVVDTTGWAPAQQGIPAAHYVVQRNGSTVATVSTPSAQDRLPATARRAGATLTYRVQAVDASGNRSAPAEVVVHLPGTPARPPLYLSLGLIGLAVLALAYALLRRRMTRRLAQRDVADADDGDETRPAVPQVTSGHRA